MSLEPAPRGVSARVLSLSLLAMACACLAGPVRAAVPVPTPATPAAKPPPITFTVLTDSLGFRWDVQANGMVTDGTNDCFDGGMVLQVNGQAFPTLPRVSAERIASGRGYMLGATLAGAKVTRRILLDRKRGALRYLEVFENPGKSRLKLGVVLYTTLGGGNRQVLTNTGKAFPGSLGRKFTGLLALSRDKRPSVMFLLAGSRSKCRPAVSVSGNRGFVFTYMLDLEPGKTVSLVHLVAQRNAMPASGARKLFGTFCRVSRLIGVEVPKNLRPTIANFALGGEPLPDPGPLLAVVTELAENLALERGKLGALVLENGEHVSGTLSCAGLKVETSRGTVKTPLRDVALLIGGAGTGRRARVHLRSGEILTGKILARELMLKTGAGLEMTLKPERINALFTPAGPRDGKAPAGAVAFLRTHRGDRLALSAEKPLVIEAATAWGALRVPLKELERLDYLTEPRTGHRLVLADGSRLSVILRGGALELASLRFGLIKVDPSEIAGVLRVGAGTVASASGEPKTPYCRLVGGDLLAGAPDLPKIEVAALSGPTVLAPDRIRSMRRSESDGAGERLQPGFTFEMVDGHAVSGALKESVVPIRSAARVWRVPVWHLAAVVWKPRKEPGDGAAPVGAPDPIPRTTVGTSPTGTSLASGGGRASSLVPANYRQRVDTLGFRWDVQPTGALNDGTNDCFDGGLVLQVNGRNFNSTKRMMTASGGDHVFTTTMGQIEVTRWVGIDLKVGGARYVEVFKNTGTASAALRVSLISHLGSSCQAIYSDTGSPSPTALGKLDGGILAHQRPGSRPSVLFLLAGSSSKYKPHISFSGRRRFTFTYNLQVPPRRAVSIMHIVAQRSIAGNPAAKGIAALFKPLTGRKWLRGLPTEVRRSIINLRGRGWPARSSGTPLAALESLGVPRGKIDLLVFGKRTRMRGTASCASLSVQTLFGKLSVPFKDVGALVGGRHAGGRARVFLRDGRVLGGRVSARKLRFTADAGPVMDLDPQALDRLVIRKARGDGDPPEGVVALLETVDGDRLALRDDPALRLPVVTPWGSLKVPLKEIHSLRPHEERPGYQLRLLDGSRFFALPEQTTISVKTHSFGDLKLHPARIRSILTVRANWGRKDKDDEADEEVSLPHLTLRGENVLVGRVELPSIHLVTSGRAVPLVPGQIRSLERVPGGPNAGFHAQLWGGDTVSGRLREAVLPVRVGKQLCRVPARVVVGVFVPVPALSRALRTRIAALIRDLDHEEWEKRQAASDKLTELGTVAKPLVERALRDAADPEARRRLRFLLEEMKE